MTNIIIKLRSNKRFVLYSAEFLALADELSIFTKEFFLNCPQANVDPVRVKELRAKKREVKKNIYDALKALLTEEELALFNDHFHDTLDKTLRKFLVDYLNFFQHFRGAYAIHECYVANYARNLVTPEMLDFYKRQAAEIRAQYTTKYNW